LVVDELDGELDEGLAAAGHSGRRARHDPAHETEGHHAEDERGDQRVDIQGPERPAAQRLGHEGQMMTDVAGGRQRLIRVFRRHRLESEQTVYRLIHRILRVTHKASHCAFTASTTPASNAGQTGCRRLNFTATSRSAMVSISLTSSPPSSAVAATPPLSCMRNIRPIANSVFGSAIAAPPASADPALVAPKPASVAAATSRTTAHCNATVTHTVAPHFALSIPSPTRLPV